MLDPGKRAKLDQDIAQVTETIPVLWVSMFKKCVSEGLTENQALQLVIAFIQSDSLEWEE